MIEIDGAIGEGGGQVLRTALSLSALTGQPFTMINIRHGRINPGLQAQHLKAVDAAAAVCRGDVQGARLHALQIEFTPGQLRSGRYRLDIGTAGSTSLVLQTILLPLCRAGSSSTVTITGGTHVPWAPCFHYLDLHWLPYLRQMGWEAQLSLEQAGFYPPGGGRIQANLRPAGRITPLQLTRRGALLRISGLSAVANLSLEIAERQKRQAIQRLNKALQGTPGLELGIKTVQLASPVKGTLLLLLAEFEGGRACCYGLGELGKPAERVADEAVDALLGFLDSPAAIDAYLADQLLLPCALADGTSRLSTPIITRHLLTNAEIIRQFLPVRIQIEGDPGRPGAITITPGQAA